MIIFCDPNRPKFQKIRKIANLIFPQLPYAVRNLKYEYWAPVKADIHSLDYLLEFGPVGIADFHPESGWSVS
jgi:hypothetical protein